MKADVAFSTHLNEKILCTNRGDIFRLEDGVGSLYLRKKEIIKLLEFMIAMEEMQRNGSPVSVELKSPKKKPNGKKKVKK